MSSDATPIEPPASAASAAPGATAPGTTAPDATASGTTAPTILVVEDDPEVRTFVTATLDAHGYAHQSASTGREAIALAATSAPAVFRDGGLVIDYSAGVVTLDGAEVHLTPIEYRLLCLLSRNVGKVLTHRYILDQVWGSHDDSAVAGASGRSAGQAGDLATLRVYMGSLRKKIERDTAHPRYIQTHVGVGYRMMSV